MIRLSDHVAYREYGDQTFITDTRQHLNFRVEIPIAEFLELFAEDTTPEAAKGRLGARYPRVSRQRISDDVDKVIRFLTEKRLLTGDNVVAIATSESKRPNTQYFQRYTIRKKLLYTALFEVTYRCPERCVHCYLEPSILSEQYAVNNMQELTKEELCGILDQLAELGAMTVTFTGGEPFIREDMFEILEHAHKKGFAIDVFSNGILLDDPAVVRLSGLRLHCFHSSVYSHIPEKHDRVTGLEGSFQKTIGVLRKLSDRGIYVNLKFVLMEQNKDDFHGVLVLARSMGATLQLISSISPSSRGGCAITELGVKSDEDLGKIVREWNKITNFYNMTGEFSYDDPICEAGRNGICVNPYGIVTPCNAFHYEIGNVREKTIAQIWTKSRKLKRWQSMTKWDLKGCRGCEHISRCSFCPGNALNLTGNMLKKYSEACRQAKIQYDLDE